MYFLSSVICQLYLLLSLSFKLDVAAYIIIFLEFVSVLFRMPFVSGGGESWISPLTRMLLSLAQKLIWASLYFFVFEMGRVRDRLVSESKADFEGRARRARILLLLVMTVFVGFITPAELWIVGIQAWEFDDYYERNYLAIDAVLLVRTLFKILVDGLMFTMFL